MFGNRPGRFGKSCRVQAAVRLSTAVFACPPGPDFGEGDFRHAEPGFSVSALQPTLPPLRPH